MCMQASNKLMAFLFSRIKDWNLKLLIYTIDQKPQAVVQRNKINKVASLREVSILAITSKHSNNAATAAAINALQFTHLPRMKHTDFSKVKKL